LLQRWGNWLWVSIYSLMLILLLTPFSPFVIHFVMVPLVILFSLFPLKKTAVPFLVILGIYSLINWSIGLLLFLLTLFLLAPSLLMGRMNRQKKHAGEVIFSGFAVLLGQFLLVLVIAYFHYDFNIIHWLEKQLQSAFGSVTTFYQFLFPEIDFKTQFRELIDLIIILLTTILIFLSVYLSWISYMVARWILVKRGVELPAFLPIRDWRLPRSLIWYNIIVIIAGLLIDDKTTFLYALHMNLFVILLVLFWVQGIGFFYFISNRKNWSGIFPLIGICASIFTPIMYFFSIVGLVDMLFPFRQRMNDKE
jgi:uncharacterized protein YybS (DUF2232 family)